MISPDLGPAPELEEPELEEIPQPVPQPQSITV